jgi:hypothetical protein
MRKRSRWLLMLAVGDRRFDHFLHHRHSRIRDPSGRRRNRSHCTYAVGCKFGREYYAGRNRSSVRCAFTFKSPQQQSADVEICTVTISCFLTLESEYMYRYLHFKPIRGTRASAADELNTTIGMTTHVKHMIGGLFFATLFLLMRYGRLSTLEISPQLQLMLTLIGLSTVSLSCQMDGTGVLSRPRSTSVRVLRSLIF